ncbi:hypothetical protein ACE6ED_27030 [Paenibacillus sp. CN-4]|uniref:hypothetical protein n=1 Tax=Paenibacillus nanchangensis TaxID=3348343 RepID=UPI0039786AC2
MLKKPYEELQSGLRTGDLILFSGQYEISKKVEKLEGSLWSHVGMVVRIPEVEIPLLWESTALTDLPDVLKDDHITGPKLVDLKARMESYGKDLIPYVAPRYAVRPLEVERTGEMISNLHALFTELHGIPNPGEWRMIWDVVLGRYFHLRSKLDCYTCSELVAESFVHMGLLNKNTVINAYMPSDFSSDGHLKLLKGRFGDEIEIDLTGSAVPQ